MRRAAALLAAALALVAGCGVNADNEVRAIDPDALPSGLLASSTTTPPPPAPEPRSSTPESLATTPAVYFVDATGELLDRVPRDIRHRTTRGQLDAVLEQLAAQPTATELAQGLSSALPPGVTIAVTDVAPDGTATIDFSGEQVPSSDLTTLAIAQIVLSATSVPGVTSVAFTRDGNEIQAAKPPDGLLTSGPVTAADYEILVAPTR